MDYFIFLGDDDCCRQIPRAASKITYSLCSGRTITKICAVVMWYTRLDVAHTDRHVYGIGKRLRRAARWQINVLGGFDVSAKNNSPVKEDMCYVGYDYAVWGKTRLLGRLTIGLFVHAQCVGTIISSECSAQIGSERAGFFSSSSRTNDSSIIKGKCDTMTWC